MSQVRREEQVVVDAYRPGQTYAQSTYVSQPAGYTSTSKTYEYQGVPQYAVQGDRREVVYQEGGYREGATRVEAGSRAVAADIPVESRIEYIPFEKKYTEYEQVEKVYQVPVEYEEVEYEEVVRNERVPYERTITDYYAVETQVEYIKREVEETIMVEEPIEKTYERVQYIPVETQIVHYPERDNYVPAPTKTRTEYLGIVQGAYNNVQGGEVREVRREENAYYAQPVEAVKVENRGGYETRVENRGGYETRVENRVVENRVGSGVGSRGAEYSYTTSSYQPVATSTYQTTSTYQQPVASSSYQTGYVTGGSGVRQGSGTGYVTGGSGVKTYENTTYVRP